MSDPLRVGIYGAGSFANRTHIPNLHGLQGVAIVALADVNAEALATSASILATACPYCITMFEDSIRTLNVDDRIQVKDVAELFLESLGVNMDEVMAGGADLNFTCKI